MVSAETKLVMTEDIIIGDELAYFRCSRTFRSYWCCTEVACRCNKATSIFCGRAQLAVAYRYVNAVCANFGSYMYAQTGVCILPTCTDSHHKLIRWRIVTHCAIDGYSWNKNIV